MFEASPFPPTSAAAGDLRRRGGRGSIGLSYEYSTWLVEPTGFGPVTSCLQNRRSPTELQPTRFQSATRSIRDT